MAYIGIIAAVILLNEVDKKRASEESLRLLGECEERLKLAGFGNYKIVNLPHLQCQIEGFEDLISTASTYEQRFPTLGRITFNFLLELCVKVSGAGNHDAASRIFQEYVEQLRVAGFDKYFSAGQMVDVVNKLFHSFREKLLNEMPSEASNMLKEAPKVLQTGMKNEASNVSKQERVEALKKPQVSPPSETSKVFSQDPVKTINVSQSSMPSEATKVYRQEPVESSRVPQATTPSEATKISIHEPVKAVKVPQATISSAASNVSRLDPVNAIKVPQASIPSAASMVSRQESVETSKVPQTNLPSEVSKMSRQELFQTSKLLQASMPSETSSISQQEPMKVSIVSKGMVRVGFLAAANLLSELEMGVASDDDLWLLAHYEEVLKASFDGARPAKIRLDDKWPPHTLGAITNNFLKGVVTKVTCIVDNDTRIRILDEYDEQLRLAGYSTHYTAVKIEALRKELEIDLRENSKEVLIDISSPPAQFSRRSSEGSSVALVEPEATNDLPSEASRKVLYKNASKVDGAVSIKLRDQNYIKVENPGSNEVPGENKTMKDAPESLKLEAPSACTDDTCGTEVDCLNDSYLICEAVPRPLQLKLTSMGDVAIQRNMVDANVNLLVDKETSEEAVNHPSKMTSKAAKRTESIPAYSTLVHQNLNVLTDKNASNVIVEGSNDTSPNRPDDLNGKEDPHSKNKALIDPLGKVPSGDVTDKNAADANAGTKAGETLTLKSEPCVFKEKNQKNSRIASVSSKPVPVEDRVKRVARRRLPKPTPVDWFSAGLDPPPDFYHRYARLRNDLPLSCITYAFSERVERINKLLETAAAHQAILLRKEYDDVVAAFDKHLSNLRAKRDERRDGRPQGLPYLREGSRRFLIRWVCLDLSYYCRPPDLFSYPMDFSDPTICRASDIVDRLHWIEIKLADADAHQALILIKEYIKVAHAIHGRFHDPIPGEVPPNYSPYRDYTYYTNCHNKINEDCLLL